MFQIVGTPLPWDSKSSLVCALLLDADGLLHYLEVPTRFDLLSLIRQLDKIPPNTPPFIKICDDVC